MINDLIAWVLNTYLGKYLENFNSAQLSVALLSGEVELENVPIRKDALKSIDIPIQVYSGNIGKIKLQVPVRQFRSAPWCIIIEHVYAVCGPKDLNECDNEKEQESELASKLAELDAKEAKWRIEKGFQSDNYYVTSYSSWFNYGTNLATNILENLELKINDVHIRYEDNETIQNSSFATGIKISSLTAQTCDANWIAGARSSSSSSISYKLIELKDLCVYWDRMRNDEIYRNHNSKELMLSMCHISNERLQPHHYIINPISARAQIKRERCKQAIRSKHRPRLSCEVLIPQVKLSLSDFQFKQIVDCTASLTLIGQQRLHRRLRPTFSVSENPIAWWQYAAKCNGFHYETADDKWLHMRENLRYIRLHKRLLLNPNESMKEDEERAFKLCLEKNRSLSELQTLRSVAFQSVYCNKESHEKSKNLNKGKSMLFHWFPNWWGWYGATADAVTQVQSAQEEETYKNIEDDILNALEDSIENDSFSKRDALFGYFTLSLIDGFFIINTEHPISGEKSVKFEMEFENLRSFVEIKPRFNSYRLGISLGSVCLKDRLTEGTEFPYLIRPQIKDNPQLMAAATGSLPLPLPLPMQQQQQQQQHQQQQQQQHQPQANGSNGASAGDQSTPWFELQYEKHPSDVPSDQRLVVKSRSLDIVYNKSVLDWVMVFFAKPLHTLNDRQRRTREKENMRKKFLKNWKHLLVSIEDQRETWSFEIDISAPRIIFVEKFTEKNTSIVLVDFGRFQLLKNESSHTKKEEAAGTAAAAVKLSATAGAGAAAPSSTAQQSNEDGNEPKSEDTYESDELFMTPCSTPPGSEISYGESAFTSQEHPVQMTKIIMNNDTGLKSAFHNKIYDKYEINLTDLQVLVCRNRERAFASFKNSSNFHLLDKFNISLQLERRVIYTTDPEYPSFTLFSTLPKIVAHVNEQKIDECLKILHPVLPMRKPPDTPDKPDKPENTPGRTTETVVEHADTLPTSEANETPSNISDENFLNTNVVIVQFMIGQMILEVQSLKKSIAELQIIGARAGITRCMQDTHVSMSVHGLLLVDAIQSLGADFELLVASHRHVGMDTISGSLKQSEPCSPVSPASPDPMASPRPTSPQIINKAVDNLQSEKDYTALDFDEVHALIAVDISFVEATKENDAMQIANITFNNLDIIANQETIVELLAFMKRISRTYEMFCCLGGRHPSTESSDSIGGMTKDEHTSALSSQPFQQMRREISFDFNRLNILVLRTIKKEKNFVGRKVGTLTMSEAKIHAALGEEICVTGSLGGIQIIDITPEGVNHQRIFSVGRDPLTDPPDLRKDDLMWTLTNEMYGYGAIDEPINALGFQINHTNNSPLSLKIRMASVWYTHCPRFIQEINLCVSQFKHYFKNFAKSLRTKATDMALGFVHHINEAQSIKKQKQKQEKHKSKHNGQVSLDIILNTPVIILPRSSQSTDVLVANLGKITITNSYEKANNNANVNNTDTDRDRDKHNYTDSNNKTADEGVDGNEVNAQKVDEPSGESWSKEHYVIDIRNMNLFSLNTSQRKELGLSSLPRAKEFYSVKNDAVAILHDTAMLFKVTKCSGTKVLPNTKSDAITIEGSVTQMLQVSLTRAQFEQLTESLDNAMKFATDRIHHIDHELMHMHMQRPSAEQVQLRTDDDGHVGDSMGSSDSSITNIQFSVPVLKMYLKNEHNNSLINITFWEFGYHRDSNNKENHLQVQLRSILMEDLKCDKGSKLRNMVDSTSVYDMESEYNNNYFSNSCPNLANPHFKDNKLSMSMPSDLDVKPIDELTSDHSMHSGNSCASRKSTRPFHRLSNKLTDENLVIYKSHTKHHTARVSKTHSSIDFNCLNLTISVDRWFMVLDFFGLLSGKEVKQIVSSKTESTEDESEACSELKVSVRSLNLILVRDGVELAKANISHAFFKIARDAIVREVEGCLGSISILDLTQYGRLYREKFSTTGTEALNFTYKRLATEQDVRCVRSLEKDAELRIQMSSVRYIHTKRFLVELHLFIKEVLQLQTPVIQRMQMSEVPTLDTRSLNIGLEIDADSPIVLLPLSYHSNQLIIADLGELSLRNSFHMASDPIVISRQRDPQCQYQCDEILDVMRVNLVNINLYAGECTMRTMARDMTMGGGEPGHIKEPHLEPLHMGNFMVTKLGNNLFKEKCHLKLQVERNTDSMVSHNCPDISVKGTLSELNGICNLHQYKLIRGFLSYNLGETIDDVYYNYSYNLCESIERLSYMNKSNHNHIDVQMLNPLNPLNPTGNVNSVWNNLSIHLLLENVSILLTEQGVFEIDTAPLACINFIKSSLEIDSFSDGSQDIDLRSTEILIMDSRMNETKTHKDNAFKYILRPTRYNSSKNVVQAEIHSRRKPGSSKYTILLNNMRILAILDCLEDLKNFFKEEPYISSFPPLWHNQLNRSIIKQNYHDDGDHDSGNDNDNANDGDGSLEIILNITDSELVFVEKFDQVDSNAVILRSTTVLSFKPTNHVPISIDINHLEIFSCILGSEEESALSIIDPFTLNIDLRNNCINLLIQKQLSIRLSYNDVKLFTRMLHSIPKQTKRSQRFLATSKRMDAEKIAPLMAMGFSQRECWHAMEVSNYTLNEATLWLAQQQQQQIANRILDVNRIALNASMISICVIDDCMDADVPLLELSLSNLKFSQRLKDATTASTTAAAAAAFSSSSSLTPARRGDDFKVTAACLDGQLETVIASDYYNRRLSGWEPVIEPWECSANWKYSETCAIKESKTLQTTINSKQLLRINITSSLIELCDMVRRNWMQDYYYDSATSPSQMSQNGAAGGVRRRSPFVPFALKNLTGESLLFKTMFAQPGGITRTAINHHDVLCNWIQVPPNETVAFDFGPQTKLRHMDSHKLNLHQIFLKIDGWTMIGPISIDRVGIFFRCATLDLHYQNRTRIVFDISLVGSAQKLITVKSALRVVNKLNKRLILKLEKPSKMEPTLAIIKPNEHLSIPLCLVDSIIYFKPYLSSTKNDQLYARLKETKTGFIEGRALLLHGNDNEADTDTDYGNGNGNNTNAINELDDGIGFCKRGISWLEYTKDLAQDLYPCYGQKLTFHTLVEIKQDKYPKRDSMSLPGHTITLVPPLKIKNMLCCDLAFKITGHTHGRISSNETVNIYSVNPYESFPLSITLDNYKVSGQLKIPAGHNGLVEPKLKLVDMLNRELYLRVSIQMCQDRGMEILISAPVWILNKTGLPLVYRQEGTTHSASGQFEEHEKARVVSPLMFSFSDYEGSPSVEIRLGKRYGEDNPWCKGFNIHKEVIYRELKAERSKGCYAIGINVRRGRGPYACTTFITLSPHFQLYNKTSRKLEFAQRCDILNNDISNPDKIITALPGCNFPFHWPNYEEKPLLCVRIADIEFCHWSHGLPMNKGRSLYINVRNDLGEMLFLRLEVISRGATYILLFNDAHTLPPPLRIDNYSEVLIHFYQNGCKPQWRTPVRPQSSIAYALDDPMGAASLHIEAPGGMAVQFPVNKFETRCVTYANFIYIAFKKTFAATPDEAGDAELFGLDSQQLVLGVKDRKVYIMRKCAGDRSQLWLMNSFGQLEHEGSSPPTSDLHKFYDTHIQRMVLDLETAPNPTHYTALVVRPPNKQRITTQTWRFENGRLMCHKNMCVQARDGIFGLRPGSEAVLGRIESNAMPGDLDGIPYEQCIEIQKLRPGSGQLEVLSEMDGPIRTIQIRDVKNSHLDENALTPDPNWDHSSINTRKIVDESKETILDELGLKFELQKGIGLSIITRRPCEELAYITFENITVEILSTAFVKSLDVNVIDLQIDNQLLDTPCPVLLHGARSTLDTGEAQPRNALVFRVKVLPSPNKNAVIFDYFVFDLKPCIVYLEERFVLKIAYFLGFGYGRYNAADRNTLQPEYDSYSNGSDESPLSKNMRRYYFKNLSIGPTQVRLTMLTGPKLSPELLETKKAIGLTLIKFEDAVIEFDKFSDKHHFETMDVYLKTIKTHYINQIKWRAAAILGSVDFLGNPLGFANDLSEGVSGLIFEGSVKSLVKNVTHGISNSTAKLTETLSDSLGKVVLDEQDNEARQKILELQSNTSGGHLAAGIKGFGFGLLGGVTSIVRHTYDGAQSGSVHGFLSGLSKGLVGTVTKPIIGVLDLASETATAVRESSKGSHRHVPDRKRLPRCVTGAPGGLLPVYSYRQSKGQQYLYVINRRNFCEKLLSYEPGLCSDPEANLRLLVSTEYVRVFSRCDSDPHVVIECHLSEILSCHPVATNATSNSSSKLVPCHFIEISTNMPKVTRPRVKCQNEDIAERAARCINYAKSVYDEGEQSVITD